MPYHFVHKMMSACVKESSRFMCNKRDQKFLCWYVCVCYFVAQQIRIFWMFVRLWKQFSFLFVQFFFGGRRTYKQHSFSFCELSLHLVYDNNTNLCAMCVWVNALGANIHQKKKSKLNETNWFHSERVGPVFAIEKGRKLQHDEKWKENSLMNITSRPKSNLSEPNSKFFSWSLYIDWSMWKKE